MTSQVFLPELIQDWMRRRPSDHLSPLNWLFIASLVELHTIPLIARQTVPDWEHLRIQDCDCNCSYCTRTALNSEGADFFSDSLITNLGSAGAGTAGKFNQYTSQPMQLLYRKIMSLVILQLSVWNEICVDSYCHAHWKMTSHEPIPALTKFRSWDRTTLLQPPPPVSWYTVSYLLPTILI